MCRFPVAHTGKYRGAGEKGPEGVGASPHSDVYRLAAKVSGTGWRAALPNELATARFGSGTTVGVAVDASHATSRDARVTLTATSVDHPSKKATVACTVAK
ncbi:hypothetical protein [Streptomyces sp. NPDC050560]|uniref:hypothetical protein n=1 Tax=Streptomyces sp. NPDC050560 TaxID=3365630 RepID=UPI0037AC0D30